MPIDKELIVVLNLRPGGTDLPVVANEAGQLMEVYAGVLASFDLVSLIAARPPAVALSPPIP